MWFTKSSKDVLKEMNVSEKTGLSTEEVKKRLEKYGPNKLKGKPKKSLLQLFLAQLQDMLIYVLIGAAVINIIAHGKDGITDALIILAVVLINAVVGVVQESKAEKALEALQQMTTPKSLVRRNGEVIEVNSEELVPGDILVIDAGRYIPADVRLTESANLQIEESALTGESVPSEKDANFITTDEKIPIGDKENMAFMSTMATYGRGEGVVVETGMNTEIGKIAQILDEDNNTLTPLQIKLEELGKILGYGALAICGIIFVIGLIQGREAVDMFMTAISLAVAAIPEGLVAIVAIVLSLGVKTMSRKNAIVRKLPAVETLGAVNIVCSDKTGTLTQNKMTVVKTYTLDNLRDISSQDGQKANVDETELIRSFVLCSDASVENGQDIGDPTEVALIVLGNKFDLEKNALNTKYKRVSENPFDSDRKLMSTLNEEGGKYRVHTKGAIDNILTRANKILVNGEILPLTEEEKNKIYQEIWKLLVGNEAKMSTIFDDKEYEEAKIAFSKGNYDEKEEEYESILGEKILFVQKAKAIYDWMLLQNILKEDKYLSYSKVKLYDEHKKDLKVLKDVLKKLDKKAYKEVFSEQGLYENYAKKNKKEEFYKKIESYFNDENTDAIVKNILNKIELDSFLPKQKIKDNGVIPRQVHQKELEIILKNAEKYFTWLTEKDETGLSVSEKIMKIFKFKIPYYVGPLNSKSPFAWIERKEYGKILPWNFEKMVDISKTAEKFIKRMIDNYITILPCKFTDVTFDNGELAMLTSKKPLSLGKSIVVKQFIRGKITGKVKSLKRFKTNKYSGWTMLIAVESVDRDDCLELGGR